MRFFYFFLLVTAVACGDTPDAEGLYPVSQDEALQIAIEKAGALFNRVLFTDLYPEDMNWDGVYEKNWAIVEDLGIGFQATWIDKETGKIIDQIETTIELTARAAREKNAREKMISQDAISYYNDCGE